jgi:MerR family transcriptional regulator, heat shock protein HspR
MATDRGGKRRRRVRRVQAALDEDRGVFMISVAAELAEMHPQTLRMYEARGLITPKRSPRNTRLYSQKDVERLRRIQRMTNEGGLNLAGVETVLEIEARVERMRGELERMRKRTEELERQMVEEVEKVRKSLRAEIVPYGAYDVVPGAASSERASASDPSAARIGPAAAKAEDERDGGPIRIPVERPKRRRQQRAAD